MIEVIEHVVCYPNGEQLMNADDNTSLNQRNDDVTVISSEGFAIRVPGATNKTC